MKKRKKQSLQKRLALAFGIVIISIMSITMLLNIRAVNAMRRMTYEKMEVQSKYYQDSFETEINHVLKLQMDFFNDRKLPFLAGPDIPMNDYEKRDALLSIRDKIGSITGISKLIESAKLYIPKSGYYITSINVRKMTGKDRADMELHFLSDVDRLHFDGDNFYSVRTGEQGSVISQNPNYVFVLIFSSHQVKQQLHLLNTSDKGGAFIYNEMENVLLESSSTDYVGSEILKLLVRSDKGEYPKTQRITIGENHYLVMVGNIGEMGLFVQYVEEDSVVNYINKTWIYMILFLIGMLCLSAGFIVYTQKLIHEPIHILIQAFERVKEGNLEERIYRTQDDEFTYLYQGFNDMKERLDQLIDEVYEQRNLAQKAQLKQLQAQINPHFLYNSFFILNRRIKRQEYNNAEEFARHLGNYFKYLTRDGSDFIPLWQEVEHARSYASIQGARFVDRLKIRFAELPVEYRNFLVPRLILQPLLENSFEHGVENKIKDGLISVEFLVQDDNFQIMVEDNGEEASDEDIMYMARALDEAKPEEVTGIINIHRRLKSYFKGESGLRVSRSKLGGIAITIFVQRIN